MSAMNIYEMVAENNTRMELHLGAAVATLWR
jgi:hypothetical protein